MYDLLVIDPDKQVLDSLTVFLRAEGFNVEGVEAAVEGLVKIKEKKWDLVLLDYSIEDIGKETFFDLVSSFKDKPKIVVFSTDLSEEVEYDVLKRDVVDFIRKTKNFNILSNRIRRILEGTTLSSIKLISSQENIKFDVEHRNVMKNDEEIVLTNTEFEILKLFLENKNRVLSREKIFNSVWANKNKKLDGLRTIDVHVLNLRKKIQVNCIQNRKGMGYVWNEK